MKKVFCGILVLPVISGMYSLQAQIVSISTGTDLVIKQGTLFAGDGLILLPSSDFTLSNISLNRNSVITGPANNPYIARVYTFSRTTDPFYGSIQINYQEGSELNGLSENTLQLNVHDGAGWRFFTATTNEISDNYVLTTSIAGVQLNEQTLAGSGFALPLKWRSFVAVRQLENVALEWSTFSEQNSKHFTVQNSANGTIWNLLGTLAAAGNSNSVSHYKYLHVAPAGGYHYYRIIETDFDGKQHYSVVQKILLASRLFDIVLLRQPVISGLLTVRVDLARPDVKAPILKIYSTEGKLLQKQEAAAGINNLNVSGYPAGTYLLQADSKTVKFTIQ